MTTNTKSDPIAAIEDDASVAPGSASAPGLPSRHPFNGHDLERVDEVAAVYAYTSCKTIVDLLTRLSEREAAEVWHPILRLLDAGWLRPHNEIFRTPTANLLVPDASPAVVGGPLTKKRIRDHVRRVVLPALLADTGQRAGWRCGAIVQDYLRRQDDRGSLPAPGVDGFTAAGATKH